MEFFKSGLHYDFMKYRIAFLTVSGLLVLGSVVAMFVPGPKLGVDFSGGTEVHLAFKQAVDSATVRGTLSKLGYQRAEVVAVEGKPREYIVRVADVSALTPEQTKKVEQGLSGALGGAGIERVTWSPGGDKVSIDLDQAVSVADLNAALTGLGVRVRTAGKFGKDADNRYEAQLVGVADRLVAQLQESLGDRGPEAPLRVEWVGPKAGEQLRDAAIQSFIYAVLFIMAYVAFRFDLRFAPGGIVALVHDAVLTAGFVTVTGLEFNLQTVAAILTIVGYSINDTIVIFDRIRENMGRLKDKTLRDLINLSTSQTLSRTLITSSATMLSMVAFLVLGTQIIREMAITLIFGMLVGVYSTVFIASPVTEWVDRRFFRKTATA